MDEARLPGIVSCHHSFFNHSSFLPCFSEPPMIIDSVTNPLLYCSNSKSRVLVATMTLSCWFFWAWWLPLVLAVTAADEQGEGCSGSAKRCGNLTISDPFWLTERETDKSCGSLDFEITCYNNTPVLRSSLPFGFGLAITDIAYKEGRLHVIDLGKLESLHASNSCHVSRWNTSDKLGPPFKINPVNLNLIFYNCTEAAVAAHPGRALVEMKCSSRSRTFVQVGGLYRTSGNPEGYYLEGCISTFLPVLETAGKANASDYEQLIRDGFVLTWQPPPAASGKLNSSNFISASPGCQASDSRLGCLGSTICQVVRCIWLLHGFLVPTPHHPYPSRSNIFCLQEPSHT